MKILLACFMCLLLGASECFAIKGGPVYPVGTNIVGTYAGVLQGVFDPTNPAASNSIGLFSLGVPSTGLSTGNFVMFAQGRTFSGTIQASGDPNTAAVKGILTATFNYTLNVTTTSTTTTATGTTTTTTITPIAVTASVNGNLNATVAAAKQASIFSTSATLLRGSSTLFIDQGHVASNGIPVITGTLTLTVNGFKQSNTAAAGTTSTGG